MPRRSDNVQSGFPQLHSKQKPLFLSDIRLILSYIYDRHNKVPSSCCTVLKKTAQAIQTLQATPK